MAAACSEASITLPADAFTLGEGRLRLRFREEALVLEDGDRGLVSLRMDAFQLGVSSAPAGDWSFDPAALERTPDAASRVAYRAPIRWSKTIIQADHDAIVDLDYGDGLHARVAIALAGANRFTLTVSPSETPPGKPVVVLARVRVRSHGDPTEGFYGLGANLDAVDNRGKLRSMQLAADDTLESGTNEVHVPVPVVIATSGWGMFVSTARVGVFDVARKDPRIVEATFAATPLGGETRARALRVDLFGGGAPIDLYREYYAAAGTARPPPAWAFGVWAGRRQTKDQATLESDVRRIRELGLSITGIVVERPYARAVNTFDFDPATFPDPGGFVGRAHAAGLRVALWSAPYLEERAEPARAEATARGFFPKAVGALRNPFGAPIDFTSPEASSFWRSLVQRYTSLGIDGFKLDFGEDVVPSLEAKPLERNVWTFSDASDERTMHHRFSGLYHRVYSDAATGREPGAPPPVSAALPFMLVRSAHWGEQSLGVVVAPAELDATFARHRDGGRAVGGLPAAVALGLSSSASGFPFFATDLGTRHGPAETELVLRWIEATALSPTMALADLPLETTTEPAILDHYRTYARLHTRLFPYAFTHALRAAIDGRPLQRPVGLLHPELGQHPSDEFFFGDDLLVAPVVNRGETRRRLVAPPGTWIDFWDGSEHVADPAGVLEIDAPADRLPLLLRAGTVLPLLREEIDTLGPASAPAVAAFGDDPGPLWALIVPGGPPRGFDVWDGTRIARIAGDAFEVRSGTVFDRGFVLEVALTEKPTQVVTEESVLPALGSKDELARGPAGWIWTAERRGTVRIKLPKTSKTRSARVFLR